MVIVFSVIALIMHIVNYLLVKMFMIIFGLHSHMSFWGIYLSLYLIEVSGFIWWFIFLDNDDGKEDNHANQ